MINSSFNAEMEHLRPLQGYYQIYLDLVYCAKVRLDVLLFKQFIGGLVEHEFRLRKPMQTINLPTIKNKINYVKKSIRLNPETKLQCWKEMVFW